MPAPKRRLTAFAVAMAVLIATPLAVMASDRFTDVPDNNVHHADITWLADAGVTLGCNPPANNEFCPEDAVLRQQMASFLRRLAENQVVDAATAVSAEDADALGGAGPSAYQTLVFSTSCQIVVSGGVSSTTCPPVSTGVVPMDTTLEMFELDLDLPADGVVQLNLSSLTGLTMWLALNENCVAYNPIDAQAIFDQALKGQLFINGGTGGTTSAQVTIEAPAGTHTIRQCGVSPGVDGTFALGELTAQWSQGGSVELAGSVDSQAGPIDLSGLFD